MIQESLLETQSLLHYVLLALHTHTHAQDRLRNNSYGAVFGAARRRDERSVSGIYAQKTIIHRFGGTRRKEFVKALPGIKELPKEIWIRSESKEADRGGTETERQRENFLPRVREYALAQKLALN